MIYRAIGVYIQNKEISISFSEFHENAGTWTIQPVLFSSLIEEQNQPGNYINDFIIKNNFHFKVALIAIHSDGSLLINGASIAAITSLPVIAQFNNMDIELGGNGDMFLFAASKLRFPGASLNDEQKSLCIALLGILRWREEYNFLSSITGATRSSIGGVIWMGMGD